MYIIGFNTGLIPRSSLNDTGLLTIATAFGVSLLITNLGTTIDIRAFIKEWKIVVVCCSGILVLGIVYLTLGAALFGMDYALAAYPPIAGGMAVIILMSEHVLSIGRADLSSFIWFVGELQLVVGIPVASFFLKKCCIQYVHTSDFANFVPVIEQDKKEKSFRLFPPIPEKYNSNYTILAKLLFVTWLSVWLAGITSTPSAVFCLILGVVFCEIGFLDRQALQKSGMTNMLMFCLLPIAPNSFSSLTMSDLISMVIPVIVFLALGTVALIIGGFIGGKLLKMQPMLAITLSLNALFGFPFNIMITDDVVRGLGLSEEDSEKLKTIIQPKMAIAGFVSVTIVSVILAGYILPFIK